MSDFNIPYATEQFLAARIIVSSAKKVSTSMDKFLLWILTGSGAGLTYLLGQSTFTQPNLRIALGWYLSAFLVAIGERYLAMVVDVGATASQKAEKLTKSNTPIDIARFMLIYIKSTPALYRGAAAWGAKRVIEGDLTASARGLMRLMIVQCNVGFISIILLAVAVYSIVKDLPVAMRVLGR
jgi:hypothetical protein